MLVTMTEPTQPELINAVHERIGELFARDHDVYGRDLRPYTGHVHRVAELTAHQVEMRPEWVELVAVAAYYHDAAIWFEDTWDYLPGSERRAEEELAGAPDADRELVHAMIDEHHRVRHARHRHPLVEAMRRADATDIYRVVMSPGTSLADYRDMLRRFPDAGFHAMLARGFILGLKERKRINPMPMVKF